MVFYNTEEERYFTVEMRFSERMHANELLIFHLIDVIREMREKNQLKELYIKKYKGECDIYHVTAYGEYAITEQLREIAKETVYLVYKDGKLIQP